MVGGPVLHENQVRVFFTEGTSNDYSNSIGNFYKKTDLMPAAISRTAGVELQNEVAPLLAAAGPVPGKSPIAFLIPILTHNVTNEIDGFFRLARREEAP